MYVTLMKLDQIHYEEGFFEPLNESEFEELVESIRNFGLIYPLTVQKISEKFYLIDGRNRLRALKRLGVEIAPVIVLENEDARFGNVLQYDLELCRRHLDEEKKEIKTLERNDLLNAYIKSLRLKTFQNLKIEDSDIVSKYLDTLSVQQLEALLKSIEQMKMFNHYTNHIAKSILSKEIKTQNSEETRKIEERMKALFEKRIEELEDEMKRKESIIIELTAKNEEYKEKIRHYQEEFERMVQAGKELKEKIEERLREEFEKKKEHFMKEFAENYAPEELEERARKYAEEKVAHLRAQYELELNKAHKQTAEWRAKADELTKKVLQITQQLEKMKEEQEKLEKEKRFIQAEKDRYLARINDYKVYLERIASPKTLILRLHLVKNTLSEILNQLIDLDILIGTPEDQEIKRIWEEIENILGIFKEELNKRIKAYE